MKKQNIVKLFFIIVCTVIIGILVTTFNKIDNYVEFNYKIESIEKNDKGMYITFVGDENLSQKEQGINISYVIYKNDVDLDILSELKIGEYVNITVEDNYGSFQYTIIYKMEYKNEITY